MRRHFIILIALMLLGCPEQTEDAPGTTQYQPTFGSASPQGTGGTTITTTQNTAGGFGDKDTTAVAEDDSLDAVAVVSSDTQEDVSPTPDSTSEEEKKDINDGTRIDQPDIDTYVAVPTDIEFEEPDTGCTPNCEDKVCGGNGCGSVCGFCEYGKACNDEGQCIPVCDPVTPCEGKLCGPDGCGGSCGACDPNFACGEDDGLCYETDCLPQCDGKECGEDLCGGICGTCQGTKLCDQDIGQCVSNPCGSIDFKGACADKTTVAQCVEGEIVLTNCALEDPAYGCLWNPLENTYQCDELPDCTPDCSDKQCGDGGCNYNCGNCYEDWTCENFTCIPQLGGQCGTVPEIGVCINNDRYFCSEGSIGIEPCSELGKTCKFEPANQSYVCE